jgi:signal transduction histidine kinase
MKVAAKQPTLPFADVPWWRRLHVRLAFWVLLSLGAITLLLSLGYEQALVRERDAHLQWQNLGLAKYIAQRQPVPFMDAQGRVHPTQLANSAMYIGMIHPALEAYVLDRQGRILQHTLGTEQPQRERVDLRAVAPLLNEAAPQLPVFGDDPRNPGAPNLVSIAALPDAGNVQGYLYVVLNGRQGRAQLQQSTQERQQQGAWQALALGLGLAGVVIIAVQTRITRRLRLLATELAQFRQPAQGNNRQPDRPRDEIDVVRQAAEVLQLRVNQQFSRLEEAERLRRELVSNVSHDLHTPLTSIQGYVETLLLRGAELPAELREQYLRTCLQHCRSLGRRVAELFELSKLESGQTVLQAEPFCVAELINDLLQNYSIAAQARGVTLQLAETADRQAQVLADIGLIERVLQNLIDNALRHTPSGGRIELLVSAADNAVQVQVHDNGHGIPAADLPHIFERYWSKPAPEDGAVHTRSTGLGLAIARCILELHGSRIEVQSAPQSGTAFCFGLPAALHG